MMCSAPRCEDDARYVVHEPGTVVRLACITHAAAASLFSDVLDVQLLPDRASPERAKRPRRA